MVKIYKDRFRSCLTEYVYIEDKIFFPSPTTLYYLYRIGLLDKYYFCFDFCLRLGNNIDMDILILSKRSTRKKIFKILKNYHCN